MSRMRRSAEQTLELKIELAEAKVVKTRAAHEKAVDELKKLYDIQKEQQRNLLFQAIEDSEKTFDEIMWFIKNGSDE